MEHKTIDKLTLCCLAAKKAGMSYGKYMALHAQRVPDTEAAEIEGADDLYGTCPMCGKRFLREGLYHNKKYCGHGCYAESQRIKCVERYRKKAIQRLEAENASKTV